MNRQLKAKIIENYGHQWRFAKAVNERESVVSEIINGKRCLTDKKKKSWGRALKADPETLFPTNE